MMMMLARWLPHPLASALLLLVWLLLHDSVSAGHGLLGGVLALVIPLFTRGYWKHPVAVRRPGLALRLAGVVLVDIVIASFAVAGRVLGAGGPLNPGFVRVPLSTSNEYAVTALASIVSLTPGTVSADVDTGPAYLLVHALDVDDEAALIATVKQRYEAPLLEILP